MKGARWIPVLILAVAATGYAVATRSGSSGTHRSFPAQPDPEARVTAIRFAKVAFAGDGAAASSLIANGAAVPCCGWTRRQSSLYARRHYRLTSVTAAYPNYDVPFVGRYSQRGKRKLPSGRVIGHPLFCATEHGSLHIEMARQGSRWVVWNFGVVDDDIASGWRAGRTTCDG